MAKKPEPIPTIDQLVKSSGDRMSLIRLSKQRQLLQEVRADADAAAAQAKADLQEYDAIISRILDRNKLSKTKMELPDGSYLATWIGKSSFVNAGKLLLAGVDPDTVLDCTDVTEYQVIRVTTPDEDADIQGYVEKRKRK